MKGFLPLYIDLSFYSNSIFDSLIDFGISNSKKDLADIDAQNIIESCIRYSLKACTENNSTEIGIVFLLDGLDKTGNNKNEIVDEIEKLKNRYTNSFIVVTSNAYNYFENPIKGFTHYIIQKS